MQPGRGETDDDVARLDPRPVDQPVPLDEPDAGAGEVELIVPVDPGQLRRLAAEEHASRIATDLRRTLDELRDRVELDLVRRDVVEEEEGLGAGREDVVDAVGREVHPAVARAHRAAWRR